MKGWSFEETYAALLEAATPPPKPAPKPAEQKLAERGANKPTEAVFQDATNHNHALAKRLENETLEQRRYKQLDQEVAQHKAEGPEWHRLVSWWQSVLDAREAARARYREDQAWDYSPIARFEREMRGK